MTSDEKNQPTIIVPNSVSFTFSEEVDVVSELKKVKKQKLRIVFFGTPVFVVPVLETIEQNFELIGVVTTPDTKVGRKQILTSSVVAQTAKLANVPTFKPEKLDNQFANSLISLSADLFIVASYGKIIPPDVLDIPKFGSINIHPSKLPEFRGATPIQSQLLAGVKASAISFILVDAKMDHGPLLLQEPFHIADTDTNETLHDSMFLKAAQVLPKVITDYKMGKIQLTPQDHNRATFCKIFNRDSGFFELENPPSPEQLDRMIRAFYPWPTAWTKWKRRVARVESQELVLKFLPDGMIQPEGKKPMKWKDFLNGYRDFPQKQLLS